MKKLYFLKLGGSLITDKNIAHTVRSKVLERLSKEITAAVQEDPDIQLIIGHGSGSFGHVAGNQYGTVDGVKTLEQWKGFIKVWNEARALNQIVVDSLSNAGLPIISFPPSASVICENKKIVNWDIDPIKAALDHRLVPLTQGDVVFDLQLGGTILSTEELLVYLANFLHPKRILLAGIEEGVWDDYPVCMRLLNHITPQTIIDHSSNLGRSQAIDVTGGMSQKVNLMISLIKNNPEIQALIFCGEKPGAIYRALLGDNPGTIIRYR